MTDLRKTMHFVMLTCILCITGYLGRAQDIHLSQFYETPLLRNPALAGIFTGDYRIEAVYRNQWASVTIPYQTGALSGEVRFPIGNDNDYLTGGLQLVYDVAGTSRFQTTEIMPAINYHKSLSDTRSMYLSVGFMGGITQRQFNPAKLTFDDQYNGSNFDPSAPSGENFSKFGYTYPDMATGISFNSTFGENVNWFVGASYYHFNHPKVSFFGDPSIELSPKWEYNAGLSAPLGDFGKLIVQYNQIKQGAYSEVMAGGLLGYTLQIKQGATEETNMIYGGLFVRWNDAVVPVIKLQMNKYDVGFSYDINVSQLSKASQTFGGFEISLSYIGFFKSANSSASKLECPRF
ncbi:MAG: type IX secretion system membrane protein PorP/SprF [Chitinophagaceae bacterium]|nr:MAG: type IX secretion system membrane protein PorP/SprF [Chitinophagaceae bacterium]